MFTNRGLMRCIKDQIPVGVLREREPVKGRSQCDVLGLAVPVRWYDGYFLFESTGPDGAPSRDTLSDILEAQAEADAEHDDQTALPPTDDYDARLRLYKQIVARRGQARFARRADGCLLRALRGNGMHGTGGTGGCALAAVPRTGLQRDRQWPAPARGHPHAARPPAPSLGGLGETVGETRP